MNIYLLVIIIILVAEYLLSFLVETLNIKSASPKLPNEFEGFYNTETYKKSQAYLADNTRFSLFKDGFFTVFFLIFIMIGGFNFCDTIARSLAVNSIMRGLIFAGILFFGMEIIGIPFSLYKTFYLEEKYGFNRTTVKTFILDKIKEIFLGILIGGAILAAVLWFFEKTGSLAWLYSWAGVVIFELFLAFIAPIVILPLFNKFIPIEEGSLKHAIEDYARSQNFKLSGIFKMDASKRSAKSNAFFIGFGRFRRIALYDTLIEKHTREELVSVLAHEIGHYKMKHFIKHILMSILTSGFMFFILSFFINNKGLFEAFRMENLSIYGSLFFFAFLYSPINFIFDIVANIFSRKHEYEADKFAKDTYNNPEAFVLALKKLSVDNLSNLTPHPVKVFLDYSHPPVLERIKALKKS